MFTTASRWGLTALAVAVFAIGECLGQEAATRPAAGASTQASKEGPGGRGYDQRPIQVVTRTTVMGDASWQVVFSPNGRRYASIGKRGEPPIIDGHPAKSGGLGLQCGDLVFSPDGNHLGYLLRRGGSSSTFVLDDIELPVKFGSAGTTSLMGRLGLASDSGGSGFPSLDRIVFSQDSQHYAVIGVYDNRLAILHDGKLIKTAGTPTLVALGPRGELAFVEQLREAYAIHVNGAVFKTDERVQAPGWLTFSPDGKRWACAFAIYTPRPLTAIAPEGMYVMVDGQAQDQFQTVGHPRFSADSRHIAYVACQGKNEGQHFMVLDGKKGRGFAQMCAPVFSPTGSRLSYLALEKGKGFILCLDDKERILDVGYDSVDSLVWSPDGSHVAARGTTGLYVDGELAWKDPQGRRLGWASNPAFTPDAKHNVCVVREILPKTNEAAPAMCQLLMLDGKEVAKFEGMDGAASLRFYAPGLCRFATVKDKKAVLVQVALHGEPESWAMPDPEPVPLNIPKGGITQAPSPSANPTPTAVPKATTLPGAALPAAAAPKPDTGEAESKAAGMLQLAKSYRASGMTAKATEMLQTCVKTYPGTAAAQEAARLLKQ